MFEVISTGKNIEQAIENALFELKCPREDVDIRILEQGGMFKKAKVQCTISEDVRYKYEKRAERKVEVEPIKEEKSSFEIALEEKEQEEKTVKFKESLPEEKNLTDANSEESLIAKQFISTLCEDMQANINLTLLENEEELFVNLDGEDADKLIGFHGDGLNALQYLLSVITSKTNRHARKVRLNINNYREKRERTLTSLAERLAAKVVKTGRPCKLEPMTANERRIIHSALQNNKKVTTTSYGEEPRRYLTILPAKDGNRN